MTSLIEWSDKVIHDLETANFQTEAKVIQDLSRIAADGTLPKNARNEALTQLIERCHMKWLGDLYLPHLAQNEWWSRLSRLGQIARKMKKSIDQSGA